MPNSKIIPVRYADATDAIQTIRRAVFQAEQGVPPDLEFDGLDAAAEHLLAYLDGEPVGTARLRALDAATLKIERLAVLARARGRGLGRQLMQAALERATARDFQTALIHAQAHLQDFYAQLGFESVGDRFYEAAIAHVKMKKLLA